MEGRTGSETSNIVITERAPCGLLCVRCESFLAKRCSGCYNENKDMVEKCPVLGTEPFEESINLIMCMRKKEVENCGECSEFGNCIIYEALLLKCPFKGPVYALKHGNAYLVKERKPDMSFKIFSNVVRHGAEGLCISRQHPDKLDPGPLGADFEKHWLTTIEGKGNIAPTDMGILSELIIRFIENREDPIVLLDGIELLITHNDFPKVLRMLNHITEQVMEHNGRMIISVDERTLDRKEIALVERDMVVFGG